MTTLFEIAVGPMLWILVAVTLASALLALLVVVTKKRWSLAVAAVAAPLVIAAIGAWLELRLVDHAMVEEQGGLAAVGPPIARALVLSMLGFAATLAPAIPSAVAAPRDQLSRWSYLPLLALPIFAYLQLGFTPLTALIRLVPYAAVIGTLLKRRASLSILLPIVAAGESAAMATAHVDFFSSLALSGISGREVASVGAAAMAAGRWYGVAAFASVALALLLDRRWRPLLFLAPICAGAAWLADPTARIVALMEPQQPSSDAYVPDGLRQHHRTHPVHVQPEVAGEDPGGGPDGDGEAQDRDRARTSIAPAGEQREGPGEDRDRERDRRGACERLIDRAAERQERGGAFELAGRHQLRHHEPAHERGADHPQYAERVGDHARANPIAL